MVDPRGVEDVKYLVLTCFFKWPIRFKDFKLYTASLSFVDLHIFGTEEFLDYYAPEIKDQGAYVIHQKL
jgi:hypothetical protein